jgi:anti-sigma factor RsiW
VVGLVKSIKCREAVSLIGDYLEGGLARRDRRRLEAHLAVCEACSTYLEQMRVTITVTGTVGPEDLSPEALEAILDVFDNYQRDRREDFDEG